MTELNLDVYERNQHFLLLLTRLRKKVDKDVKDGVQTMLKHFEKATEKSVRTPSGGMLVYKESKSEQRSITFKALAKVLEDTGWSEDDCSMIVNSCRDHVNKNGKSTVVKKVEYMFPHPTKGGGGDGGKMISSKSVCLRDSDELRCMALLEQQLPSTAVVLAPKPQPKPKRTRAPDAPMKDEEEEA